jgi:TldD protein
MQRRDFVKSSALAAGAIALAKPSVSGAAGHGVLTVPAPQSPAVDPATRDLLMEALDAATSAGAQYADARVGLYQNQRVGTREDKVTNVSETSSLGIGVRALVNGKRHLGWGARRP